VAVASAHAVLDVIEEEGLCERANVLGAELVEVLNELKQSSSTVQEIRALGSMVAIELETADQAKAIQNYAMQNGLLILTCGRYGNVIRFLYPLTIPAEQFRAGLNILKQGFALSAAA
jgi:4-aminobutyrate aminotransferase